MGEDLWDALLTDAAGLRWLEKYTGANALILLSRLARAHGLSTLNALEDFVGREEEAMQHKSDPNA